MKHLNSVTEHSCKLNIDNKAYEFKVNGEMFSGNSEVLYNQHDEILKNQDWEDEGYDIVNVFNDKDFKALKDSVKNNIVKGIELAGVEVDYDSFELENYHKYIYKQEDHLKVINHTRNLRNDDFAMRIEDLADKVSKFVNYPLTSHIKELGRSHIQIRISRPESLDINPPHRDGYLSYWEKILNVWIPIAGCNKLSSLPVVSGSHFIPENEIIRTKSKGAYINGNLYHVPCVISTTSGNFNMIRPNPKEKDVLIFTPFLIHGAAVNQNTNTTRVSLELRFDKK